MSTPEIHLCIVTGQPLANLIPILQYRPGRIALGVTPTMRPNAATFRKLLDSLGYGAERVDEFGVPESGIEAIREAALHIETALQKEHPGYRIAYNATGGTKLMALGFFELIGGGRNTVFYTDTAQQRMEFVHPKARTEAMQSVLNIDTILRAHGKQPRKAMSDEETWRTRAAGRKETSKWLAEHAADLADFFGVLNRLTQDALEAEKRGQPRKIVRAGQTLEREPWGLWREALDKLKQAGIFQWDKNQPRELYFHDAEGAEYAGGKWLEEYVWHVVRDEQPEEVKAGLELTDMAHSRMDVRNELDGIAAHRNRLLLIECKTANLSQDEKNADVIYKMDSIGNDLGLFQTRLLLSARKVDDRTRARAREEQIEILDPASPGGLKSLRQMVQHWMSAPEKSLPKRPAP